MHLRLVLNKNKGVGDSNSLAEFALKGIPMTNFDGVRFRIGDNLWEDMSNF